MPWFYYIAYFHYFSDSYWDPALDMKLMGDRSTLNLLYSQTVSDVEKGWIVTDKATKEKLATLQSRGAKREVSEYLINLIVFTFQVIAISGR